MTVTPLELTRPASVTDAFLRQLVARVPGSSGETWKLTEVYTGEALVELPQSTPADIEQAFAAAREAQRKWAATLLKDRLAVFKRAHALFVDRARAVADLIQVESGKNRRMAIEETCDPAMVMSHYLRRAAKLLAPVKRGGPVPLLTTSTEVRQPKGVVGIIAPWNFPFATGISDAIPALMAGNAVVLKPDNKTALSPLYGIQMLEEAGLPKGLFQVVCGEGPDVGPTLIDQADYVMFTGSTATGRVIGERAGRNLIGCCLELGGKNPMIVLPDADIAKAATGAVTACFSSAGQLCVSVERIYVHEDIRDEFLRAFVARTAAVKLGGALDYQAQMGSLTSSEQLATVSAHVEDARAKGASVLTGGRARPDLGPLFYEPTVLSDVTPDMVPFAEETFGPVVSVYGYTDVTEAIDRANDTPFGLNASVWSRNGRAGWEVAARLKAGTVNVNEGYAATFGSVGVPMGGMKDSGVGRRNGAEGLLKYTESQSIALQRGLALRPPRRVPGSLWAKGMTLGLKALRRLPR